MEASNRLMDNMDSNGTHRTIHVDSHHNTWGSMEGEEDGEEEGEEEDIMVDTMYMGEEEEEEIIVDMEEGEGVVIMEDGMVNMEEARTGGVRENANAETIEFAGVSMIIQDPWRTMQNHRCQNAINQSRNHGLSMRISPLSAPRALLTSTE